MWTEVARLFDELCRAWADVDSGEGNIVWLRGRLEHFRAQVIGQSRIYEVSLSERLRHAKNRADVAKGFGQLRPGFVALNQRGSG